MTTTQSRVDDNDHGEEPAPVHEVSLASNVMVPMRDGIRLATDIYRPSRDAGPLPGPWPSILQRTSYDKSASYNYVSRHLVPYLVPRGYAVVVQDVAGRYQSESRGPYTHTVNPHEGRDGFDTVEWIASQPWSNGRVGTIGFSHGSMTQSALALYRPPHLAAMFAEFGPFNFFTNGARQGGALELRMLGAVLLHALESQQARADPLVGRQIERAMEDLVGWIHQLPLKLGMSPLSAVPELERVFFDYYTRGDYDEFWKQDSLNFDEHFESHADVPIVIRSGWFDSHCLGGSQYYQRLASSRRGPVRLICGPWTHGAEGESQRSSGDVDFGPAAIMDINAYRLRWFERHLRSVPSDSDSEAAVRIFIMGGGDGRRDGSGRLNHGGSWRSEREWPLARTEYEPYYFHVGGNLRPEPSTGGGGSVAYEYDPRHPVPTISANVSGFNRLLPKPRYSERMTPGLSGVPKDIFGGEGESPWLRMSPVVQAGASHQKEEPHIVGCRSPYPLLASRADVLVFQTPPLETDVEVTGPVTVRLWVSSSALDTDFTAKLIDVYPPSDDYINGYHMNLSDSILRMRYRNGFASPQFMEPGEIYEVAVELAPTANLFVRGHRIRVDISSSNFPRFDPNPNTGEPLGRHTHTVPAHNTIYLDASRPSHVVLPMVPR